MSDAPCQVVALALAYSTLSNALRARLRIVDARRIGEVTGARVPVEGRRRDEEKPGAGPGIIQQLVEPLTFRGGSLVILSDYSPEGPPHLVEFLRNIAEIWHSRQEFR